MKVAATIPGVVFLFLVFAFNAGAVDFDWKPGEATAKVKPADKLKIGQYLYIGRPNSNDGSWNMAKLNLPESWRVKSVKVDGRKIHVITANSGKYEITPENLKSLWTKLRKVDKPPKDQDLEKLWKDEALIEEKDSGAVKD